MVSDLTLYKRDCNIYYVTKQKPEPSTISSLNLSSSQSSPEVSQTTHSSSGTSQCSVQQNSTLTDNTLSMVITPWSTESWSSQNYFIPFKEHSSPIISISTMPASSASSGGCTPDLNDSKNTITILEPENLFSSKSFAMHPLTLNKSYESIATLSSWTVESFISPVVYSDSKIIKARYPWSSCSFLSSTDLYPSTMDTFNSSLVSVVTSTLNSVKGLNKTFPSDSLGTKKYFQTTIEYECSA